MKTRTEIKMNFGKGSIAYPITIPAGTRCRACADATGQYFVDDLRWINPTTEGVALHDATYYGIRLEPDQVGP